MARLPRFIIPDLPQHVILRGNNRAEIFCANADYNFYLEKLQKKGVRPFYLIWLYL
jgi:putative transposase